jgi:hypothetical protein
MANFPDKVNPDETTDVRGRITRRRYYSEYGTEDPCSDKQKPLLQNEAAAEDIALLGF